MPTKHPKSAPKTTPHKIRESVTQSAILSLLALRYPRALVWRNHVGGVPLKTGGFRPSAVGKHSAVGTSDILMLLDGIFFAFEVKRDSKSKATEKQLDFLAHVNRMGGVGAVVWDLKQVVEIVESSLKKGRVQDFV